MGGGAADAAAAIASAFFFSGGFSCASSSADTVFIDDFVPVLPLGLALADGAPAATTDT